MNRACGSRAALGHGPRSGSFLNLRGRGRPGLRPARHIAGFSIRDKDGKPCGFIYDAAVGPDPQTVTLKLVPHRDFPAEGFVWYGYGLDPYCNLTDGLDMAALAFGPIPLAAPTE